MSGHPESVARFPSAILTGASVLAAVLVVWAAADAFAAEPLARRRALASNARNRMGNSLQAVRVERAPVPAFLERGMTYLVNMQHLDGSWGDLPDHRTGGNTATTAYVALALIRAGHTNAHRQALHRATIRLVRVVEAYPESQLRVVHPSAETQPRRKLGPLADTSITALYLARASLVIPENGVGKARIDFALDKCLRRLALTQQKDGSWQVGGGWAPVLQTALSTSAIEMAQVAGRDVNPESLRRARGYFKTVLAKHVGDPGKPGAAVDVGDAGVVLYAIAAAQRATAPEAGAAVGLIREAIRQDMLSPSSKCDEESLRDIGIAPETARSMMAARTRHIKHLGRFNGEKFLAGFGNMGGEELVSYTFISEAMLMVADPGLDKWNGTMGERLTKLQNSNGSWSGLHCITSPIFCTAAVVQCMTADRDSAILHAIAANAGKGALPRPGKTSSRHSTGFPLVAINATGHGMQTLRPTSR